MESLRTAISETAQAIAKANEWQDIASAPKDGTEILCWFGPRIGVKSASWTECASGFEIWCVDDNKFDPYPVRGYNDPFPTHWLPLPPPPAKEGI